MTTSVDGRRAKAFGFAVPIAILGGLIGLGGAEFRLPVLAGPLGYSTRQAVPLNLSVSIVTILASLAIRSRSLSLAPVAPFTPAILGSKQIANFTTYSTPQVGTWLGGLFALGLFGVLVWHLVGGRLAAARQERAELGKAARAGSAAQPL